MAKKCLNLINIEAVNLHYFVLITSIEHSFVRQYFLHEEPAKPKFSLIFGWREGLVSLEQGAILFLLVSCTADAICDCSTYVCTYRKVWPKSSK